MTLTAAADDKALTCAPATLALTPAKGRLLVVLAGLIVYSNSFTKAFVYDDLAWIHNHPLIHQPLEYVDGYRTRAVVATSIQVNFLLGKLNPAGYHLVNVCVHLLAALVLFGLMRRTLSLPDYRERCGRVSTELATAVGLLWVVHPIGTHAVTYIIQRCESMMSLSYLLALYCFLRGATGGRTGGVWYVGSVLSVAVGAFCKEPIVTAPFAVLAYDWVFFRFGAGSRLARLGLYAGLFAAASIPVALQLEWLIAPGEDSTVGLGLEHLSPLTYLMTQAGVILHYIRLAVWPHPLSIDYRDWPIVTSFGEFAVPGAVVGVLFLASLWGVIVRHWAGFVGIWFFFVLAVSSSFLPIVDVANDYRMYLPSASIIIFVVIGGWRLLGLLVTDADVRRVVAGFATLCCVGLLGWLTMKRNEDYRSEVAIWEAALAARPTNPRAMLATGTEHLQAGRLESAKTLLEAAASTGFEHPQLFSNLASAYWSTGDAGKAEQFLRRAIPIAWTREKARAHTSLGMTLCALGRTAEGLSSLRNALELQADQAQASVLLVGVLRDQGLHDPLAEATFQRVRERDKAVVPRAQETVRTQLAKVRADRRLLAKEAVYYARAASAALQDRDPQSLDLLAAALAADGRILESVETAQKALEIARQRGDAVWESRLRHRIDLYRLGRTPFDSTGG